MFNTPCESVLFSHCSKQQLPEQPVIGISAGGNPQSCSLGYRNENSYIQATNTLDVHQCFWKLAKAFWRFLSPFLSLHTVKMPWRGKSGKIKQKPNKQKGQKYSAWLCFESDLRPFFYSYLGSRQIFRSFECIFCMWLPWFSADGQPLGWSLNYCSLFIVPRWYSGDEILPDF